MMIAIKGGLPFFSHTKVIFLFYYAFLLQNEEITSFCDANMFFYKTRQD